MDFSDVEQLKWKINLRRYVRIKPGFVLFLFCRILLNHQLSKEEDP